MSTKPSRRDERIADETIAAQHLRCIAHGCPNLWSFDNGGGRLCTAHAGADPMQWPAITQQQRDAETERAIAAQQPDLATPPRAQTAPLTREERQEVLRQLAEFRQVPPGKQWAVALRQVEQDGARLTPAQRQMWRAALTHAGLPVASDMEA